MSDVITWTVPSRVNLIGEHLDHNGGPALPIAIGRKVTLKARRRDDAEVHVWSEGQKATFPTAAQPGEVEGWASFVAGTVWALGGSDLPGLDLVVESTIPQGAGLASSAALTCAVACAADQLAGLGLDRTALARAAQRAANEFLGAPTGLLDEMVVLHGQENHALHVIGDQFTPVPFDPGDDVTLLVVVTGARHEHASGGYATRRAECQSATDLLGLTVLADAKVDDVLKLEDETLKARTRHVVTETARVRATIRALGDRNWEQFGSILNASHASLRDDFAVSCAELDVAVDAAVEGGALGARMIGGGFGGSALVLAPRAGARTAAERVTAAYEHVGWARPEIFAVLPSAGARMLA